MLNISRASCRAGNNVAGRVHNTHRQHVAKHITRTGHSVGFERHAFPGGLTRSARHLSRKLFFDEAKLRRKAELDYIDYRHLNGAVIEEASEEDPPLTEAISDNGYVELDSDMEELDATPPKQGIWQKFRGIRALFAYLSDRQELGKRGEGLFLVSVIITALAFFPPFAVRGCFKAIGYIALVYGAISAVVGVATLGGSFSPLPVPRKDASFVSTGIFRFVRHPFYAGLLLVALGFTIVSGNEFRLLVTALLYWIVDQTIKGEEKDLEQAYPEYTAYKSQTAKLIPFLY